MSPAPESTLADPQQVIADLQRKLEERAAERDEALAREAAIAEVLQIINSSPGDLVPVFDAMLEKATRLCEASHGILRTWDGECFHLAAVHGDVAFKAWAQSRSPFVPEAAGGPLARLVKGEEVVPLADALIEPSYQTPPGFREMVNASGLRSGIAVALRKDDALLGTLTVYRREVRPFTDKQIALLENFAAQAVIAMENARLITETREALEQQTATAEVLQVINSSPGKLTPVFNTMLEKATRLCEAQTGHLLRYENGAFSRAASLGIPEEFDKLLPLNTPMPDPITRDSVVSRLLITRAVIHVHDLREDESYRVRSPAEVAAVEQAGIRTALFVPMQRDADIVGAFLMHRREVRPFSDNQVALLENFAAQAVIAIENARLITETREALEQQTATAEVLQVINSSPGDLTPVFEATLDKALDLCGAAFGTLWICEGDLFRAAALRRVPERYAEFLALQPIRPAASSSVLGQISAGNAFAHVLDVASDAAYQNNSEAARSLIKLGGFRTVAGVPLHKDGKLLGAITIYRREVRAFTDKQSALLQNFAAQAVIAMENARLITETREALEQQTATADVLGVINSSPGDLRPVFDAIVNKAMKLCDAAFGALRTFDGELFHPVAMLGRDPEAAEYIRQRGPVRAIGVFEQIARGERVVHLLDCREDPAYHADPETKLRTDTRHIRTFLAVALYKEEMVLGALMVHRQEVRAFTDKQIALLENFAAQAVIAMENARLITETREALEQQTATAEVLGVINSSPGDLAPVFDTMLEKALRLCDASFGNFWTYDGEVGRLVAMRGAPEYRAELMRVGPVKPQRGNSLMRLVEGEPLVHIADISAEGAHESVVAVRRMLADAGARTVLWVALRKDGALLGFFAIYRTEVHPFTDKQIALLQNFAAQAVIAMENARLITETREALEQQTATAEVLGVINASPGNLAPVFDAILEKAHLLCGAPQGGMFLREGELFRAVATRGMPERFAERLREGIGLDAPVPSPLVAGERFVHIQDMAEIDHPTARMAVEVGAARSLLAVPLRKDNALFGMIVAGRRELRPFTDKQIALLQNFAAQAVIAMENARLLGELRQRTSDLEESLEYQTATSDVLKVISRSTFDLEPIFKTIVATAVRLCDADTANIGNREGDGVRIAATFAASTEFNAFIQGRLLKADHGSVFGRTLLSGQVVHVPDIASDPEYNVPEAVTLGKSRTTLGVPLLRDGAVIGVIALARGRVQLFTDRQIELVRTFADQAVIAIENARLLSELRQRTAEVAELNRGLEARVAEQVEELGRVGRLKRFLAPQLAELIVSQGDEKILESHRREIVVVFCDLRGYTAFTETAEPEEVLEFLRQYHGALGPLVSQFEGTLDQFSGDGIMVFFNDPVPIPDPAERAVKMAVAMREAARELITAWSRHGCELGFGVGIAQGFATLGQIGFSERSGYTAIGTVCNLAARLCGEAKDGQILISSRIAEAVEAVARLEDLGNLELKGLRRPVAAFNVVKSAGQAGARPNLSVVDRDPKA